MKTVYTAATNRLRYHLRRIHANLRPSRDSPHHRDTNYTTAYLEIPGNSKNPPSHYQALAAQTFDLLKGGYVSVYSNCDWFIDIASRQIDADRLYIQTIDVDELPAHRHAKHLLEGWKKQCNSEIIRCYYTGTNGHRPTLASKEKGLVHYQRELETSGEQASLVMLAIWLSKLKLALHSQQASGFPAHWLAWADASLARCNYRRDQWNIRAIQPKPDALMHYASKMRYRGGIVGLRAGFLLAKPEIMKRVDEGFEDTLNSALEESYCHDEETLLHLLKLKQPELFYQIA
jgi:hypothetical protein